MGAAIFSFGVLFAAGLFLIVSDLLKLPSLARERAMLAATKQRNVKSKSAEVLLQNAVAWLARYIHIEEYKYSRMKNTLSAAGLNMTPELFTASVIVKTSAVALAIIPSLIILPLLSPVVVFLSILVYFKESRGPDEILTERRNKIEQELPRFVATITQELKSRRDVLSILESYKKSAGAEFASELDILTADMRSASYEAALTRFEARFNSPMLSDIARGLIGVLRGDDSAVYFQMLAHDMKQLELQRLKAQAMKIPPKIRVFSFVLLMCFMLTYMAIIAYEIVTSLGGMF